MEMYVHEESDDGICTGQGSDRADEFPRNSKENWFWEKTVSPFLMEGFWPEIRQ